MIDSGHHSAEEGRTNTNAYWGKTESFSLKKRGAHDGFPSERFVEDME